MLNPQWTAAFPTDEGLVMYAACATKERLPEFRRDPRRALVTLLSDIPEAPPIKQGQLVGEVLGKIEMPSHARAQVGPGMALVGDAALATDPLSGSAAAGRCSRRNGSPTRSPPPCTAPSRCRRAGPLPAPPPAPARGTRLQIQDYATGRRFRRPNG